MKYKDFEYEIVKNKIVITSYTGNDIAIAIPCEIEGYSVTSIGDFAFEDCNSLESINIPDSVESIGSYAFHDCSSLAKVNITDIAKWCEIKFSNYSANPLYYAKNLYLNGELVTNLTIPDGVTSIGNRAFYGCSGLISVTIGKNVTSIGDCAFYRCSNLTSVIIPEGVTTIGDGAFYGCIRLKSIIIPNSVVSIGDYAFHDCSSLASTIIENRVTSIGDWVFGWCSSLTSVVIPSSVTSIGKGAFYGCSSLTSVTIPDSVTSIGISAFDSCSNLNTKPANYKAFILDDNRLICKDYIYKENEWSDELDEIEICEKGYHYCTNLFDIFNYYYDELDKNIAIYECEIGDKIIEKYGDSKCCTNKIKPVKRLYREDIIRILNGGE